jgi:hypothetical protein
VAVRASFENGAKTDGFSRKCSFSAATRLLLLFVSGSTNCYFFADDMNFALESSTEALTVATSASMSAFARATCVSLVFFRRVARPGAIDAPDADRPRSMKSSTNVQGAHRPRPLRVPVGWHLPADTRVGKPRTRETTKPCGPELAGRFEECRFAMPSIGSMGA